MVKIYGYSDDLVEIENSKYKHDEIDCYESGLRITFDDGTVIKIKYTGEWKIEIAKTGTAKHILTTCEELQKTNPDAYSDVFEIDAEIIRHRKI